MSAVAFDTCPSQLVSSSDTECLVSAIAGVRSAMSAESCGTRIRGRKWIE